MMILTAGGERIVPVRAVPYVTGSAFSPQTVTVAIADGCQDFEHRLFETFVHAGYIDDKGCQHPISYAELLPYVDAVEQVRQSSELLDEQIAAMPAGVYIRLSELQSMVDETNIVCGGAWPSGDGKAPITVNGNPRAPGTVNAIVLEGFEALTRGRHRRKRGGDLAAAERNVAGNPLTDRVQDRFDVHWIASGIWAKHPRMSIEAILRRCELEPYLKAWALNTLRRWLSEIDVRPRASKAGRRYKTEKK